jgi:integrase
MGRHAALKPRKTPKGWEVSIPPALTDSGIRERRYFKTQRLADEHLDEVKARRKQFGEQAKSIRPSLAETATAAEELLRPYDVSLLDVVRLYVAEQKRREASSLVSSALEAFRASKDGRSDKQVQAYRLMGEKLAEKFGERAMSTITGEELAEHIERTSGGPGAFNQNLRLVSAFWRWASKPPREWCDAKVMGHVERKETVSGHIGTLTAIEAKKLLTTAEKHYPETALPFAVALFTGMRREEIERLSPEDFTADGITVPAINAKTKRRRFIHMPAPLAAWLAAYPLGETVLPSNWLRKEKAVRRLAGWKVWSDLMEPAEPPEDAPEWPANALRHTAASVALAMGKPIETLVFEHGHSGGLTTLRNHYIGQVTKREALAIWSIGPHGKKLSNIQAA